METIHIPADAGRIISTSIESSTVDFGRAKQVLLSQLNDPTFKHLFIEGSETND